MSEERQSRAERAVTGEPRRTPGRRASDALAPVDVQDSFVALTDGILITDPKGTILSANLAVLNFLPIPA